MEKKSAERTFLHDVASPLTTLQLNLESTMLILEDTGATPDNDAVKMIQACLNQVRTLSDKVRERREILINEDKK